MYYKDFRSCSLKLEDAELSSSSKILDSQKFKRTLNAVYTKVDDYLERQFYLLREDCFYHLKKSIFNYRKNNTRFKSFLSKDCGVWQYEEVQFSEFSISTFDIEYEIKFKPAEKVDWAENKQLRYGSLLCFSFDNFHTYFFATVSNSNLHDLKAGIVKVHLTDSPIMPIRNKSKVYIMLETQAYYESYVHILKRLQTFDECCFPFAKYFLELETNVTPIKYLRNFIPDTSSEHNMDNSQKEAFITALTDSVSIIQGIPGSGKTTVGLWIVEKILNMKDKTGPLLIVCYTNHALDQFLERILTICEPGSLVRIGSKSESEKLKPYNISAYVKRWRTEKLFPGTIIALQRELRRQLSNLKTQLLRGGEDECQRISDGRKYDRILSEWRQCGMDEHLMVLRTTKVIGMTTTACARYASVLSNLACKVVIIEEAAEVLEAHVICSLNSHCEQLIMIGDHQQLHPTVAVKRLETQFDFNISLFERLIRNGFKHIVLKTQRRMRPEISRCILPIYPNLVDHSCVKKYPTVKGMKTNMYMFKHTCSEAIIFDTSYKNMFEVSFVRGICHFLLRHGVMAEKITVITTYRGQRYCIKESMKDEMFKDIAVVTVDSYQGYENDIIILSLVRSNFDGKIGFLKKSDRICVALSRARHGFYVVGNMSCLAAMSPLWTQVSRQIGHNQGSRLPVACVRQKTNGEATFVVKILDFYNPCHCKESRYQILTGAAKAIYYLGLLIVFLFRVCVKIFKYFLK